MTITQANIILGLGDATVVIGTYGQAEGAGADLGATEGGVELEMPREYYEKMCDQEVGVLEIFKVTEKCFLRFSMAETTLDNLRIAMDYPAGALAGVVLSVGGNAIVNELTIYLNVVAPSGGTRKYVFHKCVCINASPHAYQKGEKTMIECEFQVLQDTSKTANQQLASVTDTGSDVVAPTIELDTPADGGTVTKDAKGTVLWQITEAGVMDENSIVYGDTVQIINTTTPATAVLVAGTIVYDATAKTIEFTPTANWTASDTFQAIITTGLRDVAGNNLATPKIEQFSVTA